MDLSIQGTATRPKARLSLVNGSRVSYEVRLLFEAFPGVESPTELDVGVTVDLTDVETRGRSADDPDRIDFRCLGLRLPPLIAHALAVLSEDERADAESYMAFMATAEVGFMIGDSRTPAKQVRTKRKTRTSARG